MENEQQEETSSDEEVDLSNRYQRQMALVPEDAREKYTVTVIGVGAIGRQVALQLAAIGVPKLQLIDFDTVEVENLAAQGFMESDLGQPKVHAVANTCRLINSGIEGESCNRRFSKSMELGDIIFCCVDSIETRGFIWEHVKGFCKAFFDARMSAEVMRIFAVTDDTGHEYYPRTLFSEEEAYQDTCTAKTTIFCSNIAAGMLVEQYSKFLRGFPTDLDVQLNLLSMELTVDQENAVPMVSEPVLAPASV